MKRPSIPPELLIEAIRSSTSMRQVLIRFNRAPYGGNYDVLRRKLVRLQIDTSHFSGRQANRGKSLVPRKPLAAYLDNASPIQSFKLKKRLLREGVLEALCQGCKLEVWQGVPIPLALDHINGNTGTTVFQTCVSCAPIATRSLQPTEAGGDRGLARYCGRLPTLPFHRI